MTTKNVSGITVLTADAGKVFINAAGDNCGTELWLGKEDKAENYREEDAPTE